jgi:hypothetical protein
MDEKQIEKTLVQVFWETGVRAFTNLQAWFMIVVGTLLYVLHLPLPDASWIHLPMLVTTLQVAGLMFMLCGLQIFISVLMWPNVRLKQLLEFAEHGNSAAGSAAMGLMIFNGLSLLAQVVWLIFGTGSRLGM